MADGTSKSALETKRAKERWVEAKREHRSREKPPEHSKKRKSSQERSKQRGRSKSKRSDKKKRKRSSSSSCSSSSDSASSSSCSSSRRKSRKKAKYKKKRKSRDDRSSSTSSDRSSSSSSSSHDRKQKKKKSHKKEKKKKKSKKKKQTVGAVNQQNYGKYGILDESDLYNKQPEFFQWLQEVKSEDPETLSKFETKKLFDTFMEDFNTATLPHKKFYNLEEWEAKQQYKANKKAAKKKMKNNISIVDDERRHSQMHRATGRSGPSREELLQMQQVLLQREKDKYMKNIGVG